AGQTVELDVTPAIIGNGVYSFAIKNNSPNAVLYSSKEGAHPPELIIAAPAVSPDDTPTIASFTPAGGIVATEVTITGSKFTGTTAVAFNGTPAGFTVDSDTQIRAVVPNGTTDGRISVTNSAATSVSVNDFIIQYGLSLNMVGSGNVSLNPSGGTYDAGTTVTLTATPAAGYQFSGWSGDLSGSTNPETITMDGNKNVTATFTEIPAGSTIVHEETQTGGSASSTTVATSTNLTGVSGHLYLAAISTQPRKSVIAVTGLGLNWTLVKDQCSGLNTTGVEVWMAQGIPQGGSNGVVSATFVSAPSVAVIAVSRYSGVATANPIGNMISGNTNGANVSAACSGGVASSSYAFNLATTVNETMVYSAVAIKARIHTPGAGFTERAEIKEVGSSLTSAVAVEDKMVAAAGTVTVNGSFSGTADWAEVAVEIKPQTGGPAQHTLTVNTVGSGSVTLDPAGGIYDEGTVVTLTASSEAGFQFSGWSGDLSGSTNPTTITMDGNKNITATFTTAPASSAIVHEETETGGSSSSTTVTTSANLTGVSGHLYLAAISTQPRKSVIAVSGLGLNWTLVKDQCSGLNTTGVEVWMAQGTPSGNGAVTATLASAPSAAVIAVSRYSGVSAANPIGNVISGNTNGMNASATCTSGVPSDSYSFNLTTTANDAVVYSAAAMKGRTHAPGVGYTERAEIKEVGGGLTSSVAVEDRKVAAAGTVAVNGSFSGTADWAEVALEIKPLTPGPAIVHEETQTGGSSSTTAVTTSANLTGVSGHLYLAAISTQPRKSVIAVSGLGLNWTLVKDQCSGLNTTGVEVWMAQGIPQGGSNGPVTATLASAPSAAVIAVSRYSGVSAANPIGNVISGNTNGMNASATCTSGVPSDSYSFNLTTTANDAVVYSAVAMKARTHVPGAGYTERAEIKEVGGSLTSSIAVEDMTVSTAGTATVDGSLSGTADWAEVALEIKPQATMGKRDVAASEGKLAAPPSAYRLEQNYPNPFNPSTLIRFGLLQASHLTIKIYSIEGREVETLVDGDYPAGTHTITFHAKNLPSGTYFCVMQAGEVRKVRQLMLLK
ncbi:MAG: InlB B-repeat-containing protein, partial [bacterium]